MKIIVDKNKFNFNAEQFLRRNGYAFIVDSRREKESFVRRMGSGHYPRFHVYIKRDENKIILDLHLDQKQASYQGSRMHNAEHTGDTVEEEIKRLKSLIAEEHGKLNVVRSEEHEPNKDKDSPIKSFFKSFFG